MSGIPMKFLFRASNIFLLVLILVSHAYSDNKLSRIFRPEMLNAQIAYLETITGPALHVGDSFNSVVERDYRVDGCRLKAYTKGKMAIGYSLDLSSNCSFDLGAFLGNGYSWTDGLTIGKFVDGAYGEDMRAQSSCINSCGNSVDESVDFTFEGPHSANYLSIVFTVVLVTNQSIDAEQRWETLMRKKEGDDYVLNTRFNCSKKFDGMAIRAFYKVPVTQITMGYEPNASFYTSLCNRNFNPVNAQGASRKIAAPRPSAPPLGPNQ